MYNFAVQAIFIIHTQVSSVLASLTHSLIGHLLPRPQALPAFNVTLHNISILNKLMSVLILPVKLLCMQIY